MFYQALRLQRDREGLGGPVGVYYEFGVGIGNSMTSFAKAVRSIDRAAPIDPARFRIFGFDTFRGLPPTDDVRDRHPDWPAGRFATSPEAIRRRVLRALPRKLHTALELIEGPFEETLTPALRDRLGATPPAFVTVDCDYYTSAKHVLGWLAPLLRTGCLVYFDDIWEFWGHPEYGELAAIRDFGNASGGRLLPFPRIPAPRWGALYVYVDPGRPLPFAGPDSKAGEATRAPG